MKYIFALSVVVIAACNILRPAMQNTGELSGYVYLETGNQMPSPNRRAQAPKGMVTTLAIYEATPFKQAEGTSPIFTKINSRLIAEVHTDSTGHYIVKLPAGKYSVFIKDGNELFANESDGDGIINPVQINAAKAVTRNWKMARNALY